MSGVEVWIDLMSAAVASSLRLQSAVVLHPAMRHWPLLECRCALTWVHPERPSLTDFFSRPHQHPAPRERVDIESLATGLPPPWQAAGLTIVALVPSAHGDDDGLTPLAKGLLRMETGSPPPPRLMLYGPQKSAVWDQAPWSSWAASLMDLPAPPSWRIMASPELHRVWRQLGLPEVGWQPDFAPRLLETLAHGPERQLDRSLAGGAMRLRLRPSPVHCIATISELLQHHIQVQDLALFGPRGMGNLLLPWDGACQVRLLMRNIRARIDGLVGAMGPLQLLPESVDYIEQGALVTLRIPPSAGRRNSLLHLSLPRMAVPGDGFCDMGALEVLAEMA